VILPANDRVVSGRLSAQNPAAPGVILPASDGRSLERLGA
jgi:hypothetical protein